MNMAWEKTIQIPLKGRSSKPRNNGITMVIDKGMGFHHVEDLTATSARYIDIIKLTFGTSAFYEEEFLIKKNAMLHSANIDVMPGGTFFEIAVWQNSLDKYLKRAENLGFSTIEISDGTIDMSLSIREDAIKKSLDAGFKVITEVGKKDPKEALPIALIHRLIRKDLENGASKVIIEAREAGKGVGIFDTNGKIKNSELENIIAGVNDVNDIIWEAPIKNQQQALIIRCGTNVNLGNIPPDEILALEALRQGARGDTLKRAYIAKKDWKNRKQME